MRLRFALLILLVPQAALAWSALVRELCPPRGVPPDLAIAVIEQESGGHAYALGVTLGRTHRGYYPAYLEDATALLREALTHTPNIGIGLMQITWSVWGHLIQIAPEALLDARTNITLGCTLLGHELSRPGPLVQRIGRYHSHSAGRRDAYGKRTLKRLAEMEGARP